MEHAVAFMVGTSAVIIGLSLLSRPAEWLAYVDRLHTQGTSASLIVGYLHLIIGTFIVGFHWKWTGLSLLLTLLGVKAIIEGVVYTLFPRAMLAMLGWYKPHHRPWFRVVGVLTVVIGVLVLYEWKNQMWPADCVTWEPCFNQALKE